MTTKVLIMNHGPNDVLVSKINLADRVQETSDQQVVHPTESRAATVVNGWSLMIEEIPKPPPSEDSSNG